MNEHFGPLKSLGMMRLRLQGGGTLFSKDTDELVEVVNCCDITRDSTLRRSLILALETVCRRMWLEFSKSSTQQRPVCFDLAGIVLQKMSGRLEKMQFLENDRWFGGVTSCGGGNSDKTRIVSILTMCLAICRDNKDKSICDSRKCLLESMLHLYSSSDQLAYDLLNSDDRFLATVSSLLFLKDVIPNSKSCVIESFDVSSLYTNVKNSEVLQARFEILDLHDTSMTAVSSESKMENFVEFSASSPNTLNSHTVMAWVNGDEMGVETIYAIVNNLIDDNSLWRAAAEPCVNRTPPAKRIRRCSQVYSETWLIESNPSSPDDVIIRVHVPHVDEQNGHHEVTLAFSRAPEIRTLLRISLPTADEKDFGELEEMLIELRLMLTKKFMDYEQIPARISSLYDALTQFTNGVSGQVEECEEEEESEEDSE